jgi:hypothetical protein
MGLLIRPFFFSSEQSRELLFLALANLLLREKTQLKIGGNKQMNELLLVAGKIALSGMTMLQEHQRTKLTKDHAKAITKLRKAQNAGPQIYTDYDVDKSTQELTDFVFAFSKELPA